MGRPRYSTRKDSTSHDAVRMWLTAHNCHPGGEGATHYYFGGYVLGMELAAIDVSNIGGWVDWLVWIGKPGRNVSCAWECKEPGSEKELTEGEKRWRDDGPTLWFVVTNLMDCDIAADVAIGRLRQRITA